MEHLFICYLPFLKSGSFLFVEFLRVLCIYWIRPLSDIFANFFSQPVAYLLALLMSFAQKFLILMKSSLSIISFMDYAFGVVKKVTAIHNAI